MANMSEGTKQVRVDNWGVFFLQRLQMFFSKTDYCDLTLQFEGNVQLKVHRLVINACTEYFEFLERSCPTLEENVILMPSNLQADVIVPIVNFIYTGMLEFQVSMFDKLYKAADLMSISVLTKLLDAQKIAIKKKPAWIAPEKKPPPKPTAVAKELPSTLPGRKLPVWKRKVLPQTYSGYGDRSSQDSPSISAPDNTPKPTRFEWPDEDLPSLSLMETSVDEISFTSKPLMTQDDELQASTSFDQLKNTASNIISSTPRSSKKEPNPPPDLDIDDIKDYIKEQKIRTELAAYEDEEETDTLVENSGKRKLDTKAPYSPKKIRISEKENKETTISITSRTTDLDHNKIVADILKKYPHLMKKNKNIRLKIIAAGPNNNKTQSEPIIKTNAQNDSKNQNQPQQFKLAKTINANKFKEGGDSWTCNICADNGEHVEYHMFYMYKKHMIDLHNEHFDEDLCKYCGIKCPKTNILMYHMFTKHGVKAPKGVTYPTCNQCPYIAISHNSLERHKLYHNKSEVQCDDCLLAFTSQKTFTRHIQITGHGNPDRPKDSFDCQFCTKKYQTCTNLFSHVKDHHLVEARRDGLVLIDDEEFQVDLPTLEDYIVHTGVPPRDQDKVNIISNVKVETGSTLEPSSEAEALSNVASGIATSLNLVDIVVLDENQQYILQQTPQSQAGNQQSFILPPELSSGQSSYHQQVQQSDDMSATDELVMVLTDHDYQDGQDSTNVENSNIVVLYSHPVDGQQSQFITSQGNLMMNSEMGLLEIRNGNTSTASQLLSNDGPIESIEMIQREIESHAATIPKPPPVYYEEPQATSQQLEPIPTTSSVVDNVSTILTASTDTITSTEVKEMPPPQIEEPQREVPITEIAEDNPDGPNVELPCEPMEVDEPINQDQYVEPIEKQPELDLNTNEDAVQNSEEGQDVTPDMIKGNLGEKEDVEPSPEFEEHLEEIPSGDNNAPTVAAIQETLEQDYILPEEMEVDGHAATDAEISTPSADVVDAPSQETAPPETGEIEIKDEEKNAHVETKLNIIVEEDGIQSVVEGEEVSQSATESQLDQSETSTSQFNDENSEDANVEKAKDGSPSMKASILDDWEDTDSQQSEKNKRVIKEAEDTVNKLMDDWEEDDEDDGHSKKHLIAE